jgi:hypothetical protein
MSARRSTLLHSLGLVLLTVPALATAQQGRGGGAPAPRPIEDRTADAELDGFFRSIGTQRGQLFMEIPAQHRSPS